MNKRLSPRIHFSVPLKASVAIHKFNGEIINSNKKSIHIHNVSLGGLRFSTNLNFPLMEEEGSLLLRVQFLQFTVMGEVVWKERNQNQYNYGFKITTCNLGFYKYYYSLHSQQKQVN